MSPPFDGLLNAVRRQRGARAATPPYRRKLLFEALEPRVLLSADIASPAIADVLAANISRSDEDSSSALLQQLDASSGSILVSVSLFDAQDNADATARTWIIEDEIPIPVDGTRNLSTSGDFLALVASGNTDNAWSITGPNEGTLNGVPFSGVSVLIGGADNEDTFTFEAGGSLSGYLEGGAGGFDTLVIEGGSFGSASYFASGPDSGTVALDGNIIRYFGL